MRNGILGFTRKEVLGFAFLFISSIILIGYCTIKLIHKYYNYSAKNYTEIKNYSNDLTGLQEISLFAVNTQRSSLSMLVYVNDSAEMKNVTLGLQKNRDSLISKLLQIATVNRINKSLLDTIEKTGKGYLSANSNFLNLANNPLKKNEAATYNINTMRPALHRFNDFTAQTSKFITLQIHKITESSLPIFSQFEFWLLTILVLPYFYLLYRFLHLIVKMIFWERFL